MDNPRNLILFLVLSAALLFGWSSFVNWYFPPADQPAAVASATPGEEPSAAPRDMASKREGGLTDAADIAEEERDLAAALAEAGRVDIEAPKVAGSISPAGARIDDITLTRHTQTAEKGSPPVQLFSPPGTPAQHFAKFGFIVDGRRIPDDAVWQSSGGTLAPGKPVTLRWDNGAGQAFKVEFSIDDEYMITAKQTVSNT